MRVGVGAADSGSILSGAENVMSWRLGVPDVPGGVLGVVSGQIAWLECRDDIRFACGSGFTSLSSFLQRGRGGNAFRWDSKTLGQGVQFAAGEKSSSRVCSPS